jgi:hypothetical protein
MLFADKICITHPREERTMKKKTIIGIIVGIIVLALLIQLIPLSGRGHNPPVVKDSPWDSPQTAALVRRACYDCHSNETVWLWYSYVAPFSWLIYRDVVDGRSRLNFSEWDKPQRGGAGEIVGNIQEGEMPPFQYLPLHPSARLTSAEKQQLIDGIMKSIP